MVNQSNELQWRMQVQPESESEKPWEGSIERRDQRLPLLRASDMICLGFFSGTDPTFSESWNESAQIALFLVVVTWQTKQSL